MHPILIPIIVILAGVCVLLSITSHYFSECYRNCKKPAVRACWNTWRCKATDGQIYNPLESYIDLLKIKKGCDSINPSNFVATDYIKTLDDYNSLCKCKDPGAVSTNEDGTVNFISNVPVYDSGSKMDSVFNPTDNPGAWKLGDSTLEPVDISSAYVASQSYCSRVNPNETNTNKVRLTGEANI